MGICFIGERKFDKFIENWIPQKTGNIVNIDTGEIIGKHKGVMFYTIGQRKGLNLGGQKESQFVVKKDFEKNILYVSTKESKDLYTDIVKANAFNWLVDELPNVNDKIEIKTRHSVDKTKATIVEISTEHVVVKLTNHKVEALTPGQELVLYQKGIVLGGGRIVLS